MEAGSEQHQAEPGESHRAPERRARGQRARALQARGRTVAAGGSSPLIGTHSTLLMVDPRHASTVPSVLPPAAPGALARAGMPTGSRM